MAVGAAIGGQAVNPLQPQEASGWSIFWAMLAIIVNAMLQVSFTGYFWHGDTFEGGLWPHRSSPFVCILDAVADICIGFQSFRNRGRHTDSNTELIGLGTLTKLALFCLGVVPQAIKLFSIKGVVMTQVVAAMFLFSSITNLLRSLWMTCPEEGIKELIDQFGQEGFWSHGQVKRGTAAFGWGMHGVGVFLLWYGFVDKIGFNAHPDVANATLWIATISTSIFMVYLLQHTAFVLLDKSPILPRYPLLVILMSTNIASLPDLMGPPGNRLARGISGRHMLTLEFLESLGLYCYAAAYGLDFLAKSLHSWRKRTFSPVAIDPSSGADSAIWSTDIEPSTHQNEPGAVVAVANADVELDQLPPPYADTTPASTGVCQNATSRNVNSESSLDVPPSQSTANGIATLEHPETSSVHPDLVTETPVSELAAQRPDDDSIPTSDQATSSIFLPTLTLNAPTSNPPISSEEQAPQTGTEPAPSEASPGSSSRSGKITEFIIEKLIFTLFIPPLVVVFFLAAYSGLWDPGSTDSTTDEQSAAEEGTLNTTAPQPASSSPSSDPPPHWHATPCPSTTPSNSSPTIRIIPLPTRQTPLQQILSHLDSLLRLLLRYTLILLYRLILACLNLMGHSFYWVWWQVTQKQPPTILMTAFALANLVTGVWVYILLFDPSGTSVGGWVGDVG